MGKEVNDVPMMVSFIISYPIIRHECHSFYPLPAQTVTCANASTGSFVLVDPKLGNLIFWASKSRGHHPIASVDLLELIRGLTKVGEPDEMQSIRLSEKKDSKRVKSQVTVMYFDTNNSFVPKPYYLFLFDRQVRTRFDPEAS